MKALREQRKNDMESIVELTTISGYINDASRLFSGHNFKRTLNPFSNRVWLEVFMETIRAMDEAGKCLKEDPPDPNRLAKAFNALGNRTWIELVSKVWAKSKNFNAAAFDYPILRKAK